MRRTDPLLALLSASLALLALSARLPAVVGRRAAVVAVTPTPPSAIISTTLPVLRRSTSFLCSKRRRLDDGSSVVTIANHDDDDDNVSPSSTTTLLSRVSVIRGGGGASFDDSDTDYDDFDDSDFDFDSDDDGMFDFDAAEDDFGDESTVAALIDAYEKTPPLTKAYLTASFGAALLGYVSNGNDFPPLLQLDWKPTLYRMQVWRPLTAFLNFGPLGLGYLMTAHFVWTYMSTLERLNHKAPYDFWLMMFTGAASMVVGYSIMGLSPKFLGHNLSTFLVYVWSRYHEGLEVNMFELFNTRAELLPWFFLGQTFLLEGEPPVLDFLGIVFGHIYHHYKTMNVLRTPKFVIQWYNGDSKYAQALRGKYKTISSDFEM